MNTEQKGRSYAKVSFGFISNLTGLCAKPFFPLNFNISSPKNSTYYYHTADHGLNHEKPMFLQRSRTRALANQPSESWKSRDLREQPTPALRALTPDGYCIQC